MKRVLPIIIGLVIVASIFLGLDLLEKTKLSKMSESERKLVEFFDRDDTVISILMPYYYYAGDTALYQEVMTFMKVIIMKEFDYDDRVTVEAVPLDVDTIEDYNRAKNVVLHAKKGPTLVLISKFDASADTYFDNAVGEYIPDKLDNYENLYDFLKNDYFVPFGMYSYGTVIKTSVFEEHGIEIPDENWDFETYYDIFYEWFEDNTLLMSSQEFKRVYYYYFANKEFIDIAGKLYFNTDENIEAIKLMRDRFITDNYDYGDKNEPEEILEIVLNRDFETNQDHFRYNNYNHVYQGFTLNVLHPYSTYHPLVFKPLKLLPKVNEGPVGVYEFGAIVNINGQNKDAGYKLLDLMISDDYQYYMYEKKFMSSIAPSIKTIEEQIRNKHPRTVGSVVKKVPQEAFDARDKIISSLKNGEIEPVNYSEVDLFIKYGFLRTVAEIIFSKEYMDDNAIRKILKEFEREVYLNMNE